jgi:hypothetical protein
MLAFALRLNRGRVALMTIMAISLSACSGTLTAVAPSNSSAIASPDTGLGAAASAFANVRNYNYSMTLAGGTFSSMLTMLPASSGVGDAPFTVGGTIIVKPAEAADVRMVGLHIVEIGGQDYLDMKGTGSFDQITITGTKLARRFSPATVFSSVIDPSTVGGYDRVGSDTKDGVPTDHYRATSDGLATIGSIAAITGATWMADIWIAQDGGYPVSMAMTGTVAGKVVYEVVFDISNVNNPANTVTAPTNVTGA